MTSLFSAAGLKQSSNLEQQLLQDRLLEVIEADRFDGDVSVAADDVPAVVYVETLGRLWRGNRVGRLHDDREAIDHYTFSHQCVGYGGKTGNALVVVAIARNIYGLST